eukprot:CAMPEP_0201281256 /NCGR_PEP_ID=MMETSP1317-20130820/2078_1 /ASSEMBLY_ACC=CAM_ASM_000770 /TAXON_ID=187299 /ORGANISM="Undescribed Undescribed, Strain Undescribed" /LENGTH=54 /DNA_ID=CAMNT_0047590625 /DNA_START=517 /DNA_END=681 /DNA_ORIENTATION=+
MVKRIIAGDYQCKDGTVNIGTVRFGQTIDILVQLDSGWDADVLSDLTVTFESNN